MAPIFSLTIKEKCIGTKIPKASLYRRRSWMRISCAITMFIWESARTRSYILITRGHPSQTTRSTRRTTFFSELLGVHKSTYSLLYWSLQDLLYYLHPMATHRWCVGETRCSVISRHPRPNLSSKTPSWKPVKNLQESASTKKVCHRSFCHSQSAVLKTQFGCGGIMIRATTNVRVVEPSQQMCAVPCFRPHWMVVIQIASHSSMAELRRMTALSGESLSTGLLE